MNRCLLPLLAILTFGACATDTPERQGPVVRDSAGVRIVQNHWPAWQESGRWRLELSHAIGSGREEAEPERLLYRVRGVQQLNNGQIVVANAGSSQLLWYDEHGEFLGAIGRQGDGPGEFTNMYGLYRCAGDTLMVDEFRRVSFWDPRGEFVRIQRINLRPGDGSSQALEGVGPDCSSLLIRTQAIEPPPPPIGSIARPPSWLYWERRDGRRDTVVARFPWVEFFGGRFNGVHVSLVVPWGPHSVWAINGDNVYLGLADRPEIRMFDAKGRLIRIIRWDGEGGPITTADRRLYSERRRAYLRDKPPNFGELYIAHEKAPLPQRKPAYSRLLADDEGNLWAQKYPRGAAGRIDVYTWRTRDFPEEWTVFDRGGRLLGDVMVPANHEVLEIQGGFVVTLWRDPLDVEQIRFLRITPH